MRISDWSSDVCSSDLVASISILKDASATAVFGVRGANGVILITTKRGEKGKTELNISLDQSYASFTREPERLHSLDYMKLRNEASLNDGITTPPFSEEVMAKYANPLQGRSEEHTSELQSLMRISNAVFCLKKKTKKKH